MTIFWQSMKCELKLFTTKHGVLYKIICLIHINWLCVNLGPGMGGLTSCRNDIVIL